MASSKVSASLERPKITYVSDTDSLLKKLLIWAIEYTTGRRKIESIYRHIINLKLEPREIWQMVPEKLDFQLEYNAQQLKKIPRDGPVIFVANPHPSCTCLSTVPYLSSYSSHSLPEFFMPKWQFGRKILVPTPTGHRMPRVSGRRLSLIVTE